MMFDGKIRQGDYVYVGDLSSQEIDELVEKFVEAGANDYDEGDYRQDDYPYLKWDEVGDVWCSDLPATGRELTKEQVLGITSSPATNTQSEYKEYAVTYQSNSEDIVNGKLYPIVEYEFGGKAAIIKLSCNVKVLILIKDGLQCAFLKKGGKWEVVKNS